MSARAERPKLLDSTMPPRAWLAALGLALLAILIYLPSLRFGFVGWDDTRYITDSPLITQPGGLIRLWTTGEAEQYYPLTFTTFWLEYRLWGAEPAGYHAVNVALHAANAMLLWFALRRFGITYWTACAVGLLFVLHPVQVQSVAWIAERKNLLSLFFCLAAVLCWSRFRQRQSMAWYGLSAVAYLAAMLSKTAVMVLPFALAALDRGVWKESWRRTLVATAPLLLPAVALAVATVSFEREFGGPSQQFLARLLTSAASLWFYVGQLLAPIRLLPIHPQWAVSIEAVAWWLPLLAMVLVAVVLWLVRKRLSPTVRYGLFHFVLFLLPVLGWVSYGNLALTPVSDHYLYIPSIGLFLVIANGLQRIRERVPSTRAWITGLGVIVLVAASATTLRYLPDYAGAESMWIATLAGNPQCGAAHAGVGRVLEERGEFEKALVHYEAVTVLSPHVEAFVDWAQALRRTDRWDQAEAILEKARAQFPMSPRPVVELARMALRTRELERAEGLFLEALRIDPRSVSAHIELASLYLGLARREDAERHFQEATTIDPRSALAYVGLATSLRGQRRFAESVTALRTGLGFAPKDVRLMNLLARILATAPVDAVRSGANAVALAEEADRITGRQDYEVLDTLAAAYAEAGRWNEAVDTAKKAGGLAQAARDAPFAAAMQNRMEDYQAHRPLREVMTTVHRKR